MLRNARTFERIKKIILSGRYNKDELLLDMADYLKLKTLTQQEYDDLVVLIEENPPLRLRMSFDNEGNLESENTFFLLKKQIIREVYEVGVIEQLVTDFRITDTINREQFSELIELIDKVYYPYFDDVVEEI